MGFFLKPIIMILLFFAFFFGFKFIVQRKLNQQSHSPEQIICERDAAFDTLIAVMLWLGMFGGRLHTPETIFGLDFSVVYVIAAGLFYFVSLQIRKNRNNRQSNLKLSADRTRI